MAERRRRSTRDLLINATMTMEFRQTARYSQSVINRKRSTNPSFMCCRLAVERRDALPRIRLRTGIGGRRMEKRWHSSDNATAILTFLQFQLPAEKKLG